MPAKIVPALAASLLGCALAHATPFNAAVSDTTSYIVRVQTFNMDLAPSRPGAALPFVLTPTLRETTLLSSRTPLVYGTGAAFGLPNGAPALNAADDVSYFTGRSDNFDPAQPSTNPRNARLDPEGIRASADGRSVYISDEYGPYLYEFDRRSGVRVRAFKLPDELAIRNLDANGDNEIANNTTGRVANKGMEGLAINDHEFLVDERDGKGLGDGSTAKVKKLFHIDLAGAFDVTGLSGDLSAHKVPKSPFLDIVAALTATGLSANDIPSKIEGIAFGQDVVIGGATKHTLYVTNDNDFNDRITDGLHPNGIDTPNVFFVFAFDAADLPTFVPQGIRQRQILECESDD